MKLDTKLLQRREEDGLRAQIRAVLAERLILDTAGTECVEPSSTVRSISN